MSGSVREGKIVRVISTTGSGFMSRAEPTFILPTPQRLRTSSAPSMATCPTRSSCKARPLTPSSEGMSAAMRYIRLAWVLLGRVRSRGEDERTFLAERPARVDAPAEHEGHPLAAHLDVVVVRDIAADLPHDAPSVRGDLPALSAYGNCGQHENASQ